MYRTGDIGRWLPDGNIEFFGRKDSQVKINGHRIELGEIERKLTVYEAVEDTVVTVQESEGNKYLIAYYKSEEEISSIELRNYLSRHLPDYMLPAYYVFMERLPLSPNGKIDRKNLPVPKFSAEKGYVAPRTKEEKLLSEVWSAVLAVQPIGINNNFFSIGGDSIKSIQISSRMRIEGFDVSVKDIFSYPTIEALSKRLKKIERISDQSVVTGEVLLTGIQRSFFDGPIKSKHHYNQAVMLNFPERITDREVRAIFTHLQAHHDALRMNYRQSGENILQYNHGLDRPLSLTVRDLRKDESSKDTLLSLCNTLQSSIDLEEGPLLKLGLFDLMDGSRLLIVIHHLLIDGLSWRILFDDIETLYKQLKGGEALKLPLKTDSFQLWSRKLQEYTQTKRYKEAIEYWNSVLNTNQVRILRANPEGSNITWDKVTSHFRLSKDMTDKLLRKAHGAFNTQINDILLAGFLMSVNKHYGAGTLQIDMEGHGREQIMEDINIDRTVGWFTSIYPLVLEKP
ncbi:MAG: non-ribosomal peptide synthetase, partial [Marivirga sp.]|nr:non-ribosomal peptide synthetase [Marivirga sp.]